MTTTKVWYRNPVGCIAELVAAGGTRVAFDRGVLVKRAIDPVKFCELYFPAGIEWDVLAIGGQGAAHLRPGDTWASPTAVYPVWDYTREDFALLIELIENPLGEDAAACASTSEPPDERPVLGQAHVVVVIGSPDAKTGAGRKFLADLEDLAETYPDCEIYLHNSYSYMAMFGRGFAHVDVEPRELAQKGQVMTPSGKRVMYEDLPKIEHWVSILGMHSSELDDPKKRCIYNIKSAEWAAKYFHRDIAFATRRLPHHHFDPDDPEAKMPILSRPHKTSLAKAGDKITCDTCSLADTCRSYRAGAVCSLKGSEVATLAESFESRNAETVIEGLGTLLSRQARRAERAMEAEEFEDSINPDVTAAATAVFNNGVKLAKLLNPALGRSGSGVQINVGQGAAVSAQQIDPREAGRAILQEIVALGYEPSEITEAMIKRHIEGNLAEKAAPAAGVLVNGD